MRALVTGATGFVGRRLLRRLDAPVVLSRDAASAERALAEYHVTVFPWDPGAGPPPAQALDGVDAVFHLAGESVAAGRWTAAKKARLRDSRLVGTRNLVAALAAGERRPRVLISASAVGYYGDRGDEILEETAAPGSDFLSEVCVAWEQASQRAADLGIRVVNPRIGIVLGSTGGALAKMLTAFKLGLGSPLGTGRQWMPWIHIDDLVELLLYAAACAAVVGPCNAVAPEPVRNRDFTRTLGRVLRRPTVLPSVPAFILRLALGEFARVLLGSQRAIPAAMQRHGYQFQFPELEAALCAVGLR
jgi:uncharacterized protein